MKINTQNQRKFLGKHHGVKDFRNRRGANVTHAAQMGVVLLYLSSEIVRHGDTPLVMIAAKQVVADTVTCRYECRRRALWIKPQTPTGRMKAKQMRRRASNAAVGAGQLDQCNAPKDNCERKSTWRNRRFINISTRAGFLYSALETHLRTELT